MKSKVLQIVIVSLVFIIVPLQIYSSPPAPAPLCSIHGVIQKVAEKEATINPCIQSGHCPTDVQLSTGQHYVLTVNIKSATYVSGETKYRTCAELYPNNSDVDIFIYKEDVKMGDTFRKGQPIVGEVSSFWGNRLASYAIKENTFEEKILNSLNSVSDMVFKFINKLLSSLPTR